METDRIFITKYVKEKNTVYGINGNGKLTSFELEYSKYAHIQVLLDKLEIDRFKSTIEKFKFIKYITKLRFHYRLENLKESISLKDVEQNDMQGVCVYIYLTVLGLEYFHPLEQFLRTNKQHFGIIGISFNSKLDNTIFYFRHFKSIKKDFRPFSYFDTVLKTHHNCEEFLPSHTICSIDIEVASSVKSTSIPTGFGYSDRIVSISAIESQIHPNQAQNKILNRFCFLLLDNDQLNDHIPDKYDSIVIRKYSSEYQLLSDFCEYMYCDLNAAIIIGYNILNFDLMVIMNRMIYHGIIFKYHTLQQINKGLSTDSASFLFGDKFQILDVFRVLKLIHSGTYQSFSLNSIAKTVLNEQKFDISFDELNRFYCKEKNILEIGDLEENLKFINNLCHYVVKDSELCLQIFLKLQMENQIFSILNVCFSDACSLQTNITTLIRSFLHIEFPANGMLCPVLTSIRRGNCSKKVNYEGATVLNASRAIYNQKNMSGEKIFILDFSGLYPNIIREYNLSPGYVFKTVSSVSKFRKVGEYYTLNSEFTSPLSIVINILLKERQKYKKINPALSLAYKLVANSIYGQLSLFSETAHLASLVTMCGRELHSQVRTFIQQRFELPLLYGDTDSFFIKHRDGLKICEIINKDFLVSTMGYRYMSLTVDYIAEVLIFLAEKKRYIMKLSNGEVIKKGLQRKQITNYFLECIDDFVEKFMNLVACEYPSKNFINSYNKLVRTYIREILENSSQENYVTTCSYKPFYEYVNLSSFQAKCNFRFSNSQQMNSDLVSHEIKYCTILSIFEKNKSKRKKSNKKDSFEFYDRIKKYDLTIDRVSYLEKVFNFMSLIDKHILNCDVFMNICGEFRQSEIKQLENSLILTDKANIWHYKFSNKLIFYFDAIFPEMTEFRFHFWEQRNKKWDQTLLYLDTNFELRHITGELFSYMETYTRMKKTKISKLNVLIVPSPSCRDLRVINPQQLDKFLRIFYDNNVGRRKLNSDMKINHYLDTGELIIASQTNFDIISI